MDESDFDGSLVLERLAENHLLDDFWVAIDSDDFEMAASLMKRVSFDSNTIAIVLDKMRSQDEI